MGFVYNSVKCEFEEGSWRSPQHGWKCLSPKLEGKRYKLNVVGTGVVGWSIAGGGVIRNEKGEWVRGFALKLGTGTVIEAKLCALHRGLELAWESGWAPLEVESDSNVVVALVLNKLVHTNHRLFPLVKKCQELLERNWICSLRCVLGKQNFVAVHLATLGLSMQFGCHQFDVPPPACAPFFVQDEYCVAPPGFVAASEMKNREADRVNQTGATLKNLRVRKLIHKDPRVKNKKVKEDHESVTFTWRIDKVTKRHTFKHYSEPFIISDFKWRIFMYTEGNMEDYLSVYLDIPDTTGLPLGWSNYVKVSLTLVDQLQYSKSITKDHRTSAPVEPLGNEKERQIPTNEQPVNAADFLTEWETSSPERVPATYHNAPVSEQISMEFHNIDVAENFEAAEPLGKESEGQVPSNVQPMDVPDLAEWETPSFIQGPGSYHISGAKEYEVVSSTSADDLMDFRGLAKIEKVYVPLLDKACSCHSSLIECQKKTTPLFKAWAFTALGRVLHFLKTRKNRDMTDDVYADLKRIWEELQAFNFDWIGWRLGFKGLWV